MTIEREFSGGIVTRRRACVAREPIWLTSRGWGTTDSSDRKTKSDLADMRVALACKLGSRSRAAARREGVAGWRLPRRSSRLSMEGDLHVTVTSYYMSTAWRIEIRSARIQQRSSRSSNPQRGRHPRGRHPREVDTQRGRHPRGRHPRGRHPEVRHEVDTQRRTHLGETAPAVGHFRHCEVY